MRVNNLDKYFLLLEMMLLLCVNSYVVERSGGLRKFNIRVVIIDYSVRPIWIVTATASCLNIPSSDQSAHNSSLFSRSTT